jgi:MEMO1 family protein
LSTLPDRPRLRPLDTQWTEQGGQPVLILRDRQHLTDRVVAVRTPVALLLSLCDGTRDSDQLRIALQLRSGVTLSPSKLRKLLTDLDDALLFEGERAEQARATAIASYLSLDSRLPALAGQTYPADPDQCRDALEAYGQLTSSDNSQAKSAGLVAGLISPHIDYQRGGAVYHRVWSQAAAAVRSAELIIVLGTDHHGSAGRITPTRQQYATPFGALPIASDVIDDLARAVGLEYAFEEELNHIDEHSVELSVVWMHSLLDGHRPQVVPLLCGSFHEFVAGEKHPRNDGRVESALSVLRSAVRGRRTLVVAAADLAHVGPAFGDEAPFDAAGVNEVASADATALAAVCAGDADAFLAAIRADEDRFRVCGLPPIYLALRLLDGVRGQVLDYRACPADQGGGSWVTIAGVILTTESDPPNSESERGGARFQ